MKNSPWKRQILHHLKLLCCSWFTDCFYGLSKLIVLPIAMCHIYFIQNFNPVFIIYKPVATVLWENKLFLSLELHIFKKKKLLYSALKSVNKQVSC